jgi:kynurenine formamidase
MTAQPPELPSYRQLPVRPGAPPGSSWGLWGDSDELGTLNLLTDSRTLAATSEVQRGVVFGLGLPLEEPGAGNGGRTPPSHHVLRVGYQVNGPQARDDPASGFADRDDYLDGLWLQGSSQWDGLAHVRHRRYGNYNGIADDEIHTGPGARLGVDRWAPRGVVGRGVVIDVPGYYASAGRPYRVDGGHVISVDDLRSALAHQRTEVRTGDILLLYTGWTEHVLAGPPEHRPTLLRAAGDLGPGLAPTEEMAEYLWDLHIAALASDTHAVEALSVSDHYYLHSQLIALLGLPLGEYWHFPELMRDCAADGRYSFLLVSIPLNVRGGIGSPAQAIAMK